MDNTQSSADDSPDSTMNSRNDIEAIQMEISGKILFADSTVPRKCLKTAHFQAQKKQTKFIKDLDDEHVSAHFQKSSTCATHVLTTSTDEFITCLSDS